ncbi:hypothetical protein F5141DRAFT_1095689 [Pisolithus sp. B1]|nr:hypothetical protein F5141DRAFT_1095689 [Pisolithus sp. B1]
MSEVYNGSSWGPGLNGMAVGLALYGVSVIQYRFYIVAFPKDKHIVKTAVFLVFFLDTVNTLAFLCLYYRVLIVYRWSVTYPSTSRMTCLTVAFASNSWIAFLVQCFYAHRVWIIGGRSKLLTCGVLVAALIQLAFGGLTLKDAYDSNNIATYFSNPDSAANALASALCDAIITASIYFCLRRSQNGLGLWQENSIQKLTFVFVQMGLITFTSALTTSALYYESDLVGRYFTAAPVSLLSKTYSNSMLAVLNARKCIRDQRQFAQASPSELPTLPTRH